MTITIERRTVIDEPWLKPKPVRIGSVPSRLGTADLFFLVTKDKLPLLRVDYYKSVECYSFEKAIIWKNQLAVGIGHKVFLIHLESHSVCEWDLGNYFNSFLPAKEYLLVASAQRIHRIDPNGTMLWSSNDLGIDGIMIDRIEEDIIYGQGEWDPPGGWKPFRVELETGKKCRM